METITIYIHHCTIDNKTKHFLHKSDLDDYIFMREFCIRIPDYDYTEEDVKEAQLKQLEASVESIQTECTSKLEPIIKKVNELRG